MNQILTFITEPIFIMNTHHKRNTIVNEIYIYEPFVNVYIKITHCISGYRSHQVSCGLQN